MNYYITGEMPIESGLIRNANTVGEQILYNAKPSCKHKIQAQWSGIKMYSM